MGIVELFSAVFVWCPAGGGLQRVDWASGVTPPVTCNPLSKILGSPVPKSFEKSARRFAGILVLLRSDERYLVAVLGCVDSLDALSMLIASFGEDL